MADYKQIIEGVKPEMDKVVVFLEGELAKIRTSRASPSLVENIQVECFGQKFPLKQLASISVPEPRQIFIQPWDRSYIEGIVKTLEKTGIGASPVVDKDVIRLNLPPLTESYRQELLRLISQKQEEARRVIRRWREKAWNEIQEGYRNGEIREDDKYRAKDKLQEVVDDYQSKIREMVERKKKEIMG